MTAMGSWRIVVLIMVTALMCVGTSIPLPRTLRSNGRWSNPFHDFHLRAMCATVTSGDLATNAKNVFDIGRVQ